jgi:hypothetical protein
LFPSIPRKEALPEGPERYLSAWFRLHSVIQRKTLSICAGFFLGLGLIGGSWIQ